MDTRSLKRTAALALFFALVALASLLTATYAWFSGANRQVSAGRAEARTGDVDLTLYLSKTTDFSEKLTACDIVQVNAADSGFLMPVSTDDLVHFVTAAGSVDDTVRAFRPVEDESDYYHGRIYLMAQGDDALHGEQVNLFWDAKGGSPLAQDSPLQSAARLGLVFRQEDTVLQTRILSLTESSTPEATMNTVVNGVALTAGFVLQSNAAGEVTPVPDPAVPWDDFRQEPLCTLERGKVYTLDIYFYLEGCDPDCVNAMQTKEGELALWFFAVPV